MILKRFCYLHGPCSITVCLNHTYHFDTGRKFRFIKIEIVHHCIQIYLQYRFVNPFLNQCRNLLKMIFTCTFYQNELVVEISPNSRLNKCFGRRKKLFLHFESARVFRNIVPNADQFIDTTLLYHFGNPFIQRLRHDSRLKNIGQNHGLFHGTIHLALILKIERNFNRIDIRIVGIIDNDAIVFSLTHVQTHGHRFQRHHSFGYFTGMNAQKKQYGKTVDGIFDRSLIGKRNIHRMFETKKRIMNGGFFILYVDF